MEKPNKLTGVNKIIFEYCSFPYPFEYELKVKTKSILKTLNSGYVDFDRYFQVCINDSGKWILEYPTSYEHCKKFYIMKELYDRKDRYNEMMGFGMTEIGNHCHRSY